MTEAKKTKALLASLIVAGGLGCPIPDTPRNERKIVGAILACWSLVHGLTMLLADGLVGPKTKSGALGDRLVQGMLGGLAAELPALPAGAWVGPQVPQTERPSDSQGGLIERVAKQTVSSEMAADLKFIISSGLTPAPLMAHMFSESARMATSGWCSHRKCAGRRILRHALSRQGRVTHQGQFRKIPAKFP